MSAHPRVLTFALALLAAPAFGQAIPGDVFVSEKSAGSVVNVRSGGDLGAAPRFATGLSAPTGICVTFEGAVLVAESGSGEVTNITAGGDFTGAGAFASGLDTPMDLFCEEGRILVVERSPGQQGEITDITAGGSFTGAPSFAGGIGNATTGLAFDPLTERLFASDAALGRVFDVTSGGVFLAATPLASNGSGTAGLATRGEQFLAANPGSGTIVDFTEGGDLAALPVFATLPGVVNLLNVQGGDLLAASAGSGAVYDVTAGGDFSAAPAFASGLALDPEFAGMAHFGGCGDGILDGGEACDDGNVQDGDGCNAACRIRLCLSPPSSACVVADHAALSVHEKETRRGLKAGFSATLRGFSEAVAVEDFGQPLFDLTRYDICVYDDQDELAAQLIVARGFDVCGEKEKSCWSALGDKGYKYNDPGLDSAGIGSIVARSGPAGKGSVQVKGRRKRDEDRLPRMTGNLAGSASATVQVMVSDGGRCFSAELPNVKRADEERFQATK
jgi:cysteine-rich repeat protein